MKIKITLFLSIIFSFSLFAQEDNCILLKEKSKTKIIYDRVFGISNATSIKKEDVSTNYFYQVYHEIQRADFLERLPKLEKLKENANKGFAQNVIPLSILISDFEKISQKGIDNNLVYINANQQFEAKLNATDIFDDYHINLIASTLSKSDSKNATFILKDDMIFNTTSRKIETISFLINNENQWRTIPINSPFSVNFPTTGKQIIKSKITFTNGDSIEQSFSININNKKKNNTFRTSNENFLPNVVTDITATIPYQGQGENQAFFGQGEYEIFLDTNDGILDKPIFLVDGFDPGDTRNIATLYSSLDYGTGQNLADYLRTEGYDIVLLNFPTYTRANTTTVVDGGVDFIQRNAFILVELINQINAQKVGNHKNVVIGPSMGGLISRYALRYMEINNLNHDTRLYISFIYSKE
jgi:hypothetical protein